MNRPTVAVVGYPNVGKSTLNEPALGHARGRGARGRRSNLCDRKEIDADWNGVGFTLVDTGGVDFAGEHQMAEEIRRQALRALEGADLALLVVDARGPAPRRRGAGASARPGVPVIVAANKVDDARTGLASEFYGLGLGEPLPVSATQGLGTGDLLDQIVEHLPEVSEEREQAAARLHRAPQRGQVLAGEPAARRGARDRARRGGHDPRLDRHAHQVRGPRRRPGGHRRPAAADQGGRDRGLLRPAALRAGGRARRCGDRGLRCQRGRDQRRPCAWRRWR